MAYCCIAHHGFYYVCDSLNRSSIIQLSSSMTYSPCYPRSTARMTARSSRSKTTTISPWSFITPSYLQLLVLQLVVFYTVTTTITAQSTNDDDECVCSPRQFNFKLNLSATCPTLPPPFPPNDVFGAGVKDYTCSIGPEPVQNNMDGRELSLLDEKTTLGDIDDGEKDTRHLQEQSTGGGIGADYNTTVSDYFPEVEVEWSSVNFTTSAIDDMYEGAAIIDTTPVIIYSIQFLEVDTSFNVINQDSSYVRGMELVSGDMFNYTSISSTSRGIVPGGMNMVLRGVNAEGDPVRNVFTITYTNECGVPTFEEGNAIGWIVFENSEQATDSTCKAVTGAPSTSSTIAGKETIPPSISPPVDTTESPTATSFSSKLPTSGDLISSMSYSYILESKSSKISKSSKFSKNGGSKGSKSNYKSTDGSHGWHGNSSWEPYRGLLLRNALLNEIRLDRYDHKEEHEDKPRKKKLNNELRLRRI